MFDLDLDKTYTIRQIFWRIVHFLIAILVLYFCLLVRRDWNVTMGGVGYGNSPYKHVVPKECVKFSDMHIGSDSEEIVARRGLRAFQPRTNVLSLKKNLETIDCSGYKILIGLHGDYWASYRYIYIGINGEPIAVETVEYNSAR